MSILKPKQFSRQLRPQQGDTLSLGEGFNGARRGRKVLPFSLLPSPFFCSHSLPSSLLVSSLPLFDFFKKFCSISEGNSVLNVLKMIIKIFMEILGLGLANLNSSAYQPFWFFLTKENQIVCIPYFVAKPPSGMNSASLTNMCSLFKIHLKIVLNQVRKNILTFSSCLGE